MINCLIDILFVLFETTYIFLFSDVNEINLLPFRVEWLVEMKKKAYCIIFRITTNFLGGSIISSFFEKK